MNLVKWLLPDHVNYIGETESKDIVIISISKKEEEDEDKNSFYRAIIRYPEVHLECVCSDQTDWLTERPACRCRNCWQIIKAKDQENVASDQSVFPISHEISIDLDKISRICMGSVQVWAQNGKSLFPSKETDQSTLGLNSF